MQSYTATRVLMANQMQAFAMKLGVYLGISIPDTQCRGYVLEILMRSLKEKQGRLPKSAT